MERTHILESSWNTLYNDWSVTMATRMQTRVAQVV
jgi:hypothetical protein